MDIKIITPEDGDLIDSLKEGLDWADEVYFAVAYSNIRAYNLLKNEFKKFLLKKDGKLRVLFDIKRFITDFEIIEELSTIPGNSECRVFYPLDDSKGDFHSKFYFFYNKKIDRYKIIIGSSNFTLGGLKNNLECNLKVENSKDELFNDLEEYFQTLWKNKNSFNVFDYPEILYKYREAYLKLKSGVESYDLDLEEEIEDEIKESGKESLNIKDYIFNKEISFFLGLLSSSAYLNQKKDKIFFWARKGLQNKGKKYEGYYTSPNPKNSYKISQKEAIREDIEFIKEKLEELNHLLSTEYKISKIFTDHTKDRIRYYLYIEFSKKSLLSKIINDLNISIDDRNNYFKLENGEKEKTNKVETFIPEYIKKTEDKNIILLFLKGYGELKGNARLSDATVETDKDGHLHPNNLRVSYSIDNKEIVDDFLLLFNKIGIKKGISPLKRPERESMIRIKASSLPAEIFLSPWRRRILNEFQNYSYDKFESK